MGIPRLIHQLCNHALIATYADGKQRVTPDMVRQIGREQDALLQPPVSADSSRQVAEGVPPPNRRWAHLSCT
jgi:hypothetical protein